GYNYPTLPLADPSDVRVGDTVAALGYPAGDILGLADLSVTRGIISAMRRDDRGRIELVQTDAPIAVGNSGGPLYDVELGAVVGVVRAKGLEELEGINFAVALNALVESFPEVQEDVHGRLTSALASTSVGPTGAETTVDRLKQPLSLQRIARYIDDAASPAKPSAEELDLLVQEFPEYAQAHYLRGVAAIQAGNPQVARAAFDTAFALYPRDVWSAYYLGALAAQGGDKASAFRWLDRALAIGFNDFARLPRDPLYAALHGEPQYQKLYNGHI
ncbi:MAG TPA: trypsin-like peptidase domain-containing protein, partial [bacterium]|nr:trypsin-like peptidase domain-containing protein [bacterium]